MQYPEIYNFKTPEWCGRCFVDADKSVASDGEAHNKSCWKRQELLYELQGFADTDWRRP